MIDPIVETAPDGAYEIGSNWGQDETEENFRSQFVVPTPTLSGALDVFGSQLKKLPLEALKSFEPLVPGGGRFDTVGNAVSSILGSLVDVPLKILTAMFNQILDLFNGLIITPINAAIQGVKEWFNNLGIGLGNMATQSDLAELQSRTQALEGVVGYGHAYAIGGISTTIGVQKLPMTEPIGSSVGVTMENGGFVLGSKGLWVLDGHATFDVYRLGVQHVETEVRVLAPNGSLFATRTAYNDTGGMCSPTVHMPVVVPSAGYRVELWVNAAIGRGVRTGSDKNGLSVEKVSSETN